MRKVVFIVNPRAAKGRAYDFWQDFLPRLTEIQGECHWEYTLAPGSAVNQVKAWTANMNSGDIFCAIGGDGTAMEMLTGLQEAGRDDLVILPFPCGTGCDFARMFRSTHGADVLLALLNSGIMRKIDILRLSIGERIMYGFNVAQVGIGADTSKNTSKSFLKFLGKVSFVLIALLTIMRFRPFAAGLVLDGERSLSEFSEYSLIAAANGSFVGGGMKISPLSQVDDGKMQIVAVKDLSKIGILRKFPLLIKGEHLGEPEIRCVEGRHLELNLEGRDIDLDGEDMGSGPCIIEILPGAVNILDLPEDFVLSA